MRKFAVLLTVAVLVLGCAGVLHAAASIYGVSGLIETPDDSIVSAKSITPTANRIFDLKVHGAKDGVDVSTYGGAFGILPNLEISGVAADSNAKGMSTQGILNAKYRVLPETLKAPSVTVGVVDMGERFDDAGLPVSDMSSFVVFEKNITNLAEGISGSISKPIKGTVGFGSGIYKGGFAGLDMSLAPKFSVAVEYLDKGMRNESTFNGLVRFSPIDALSVDAGVIGFKDFYAGASYNLSTF